MLGTSGAKSAPTMERHLGQPGRGDELRIELRELVHAELDGAGVDPMPGALELLAALRDRAIPIGLATNSGARVRDPALHAAGVFDRFDAVVSAEDVERPSPRPTSTSPRPPRSAPIRSAASPSRTRRPGSPRPARRA